MTKMFCYAPIGALLSLCAAPALADHMGPSGFGSGGGMSVSGPDTLDGGHWAASLRFAFTRPEHRPDAELEALAGRDIHAHNTDYNLNASLGVAYGLNHHVTISAELPYVRRDRLREGEHDEATAANRVVDLGNVSGIGDASLLVKDRLTDGEGFGFALVGGIKLPTGSTHRRSPDGERLETEHQPGTGSWDPIFGASASARVGAAQLSASGLYQLSTTGAQATRLGDRFQGGVALSLRLAGAPPEHHHDEDEAEHHHHHDEAAEPPRHASLDGFVELAGEWEGRQSTGGVVEQASGGTWAYVAPGLRFNAASGWSVAAAFALPVWQRIRASHPDNRYRLTLSIGRAF